MAYVVSIKRSAQKEIAALPRDARERVVGALDALAETPRPDGCTKLKGVEDTYRIRVGDYRVLYEVSDPKLTVLVIAVGDRKEVYK